MNRIILITGRRVLLREAWENMSWNKKWTGSSVEEDRDEILCSFCNRSTNNALGICDRCIRDGEDNELELEELKDED